MLPPIEKSAGFFVVALVLCLAPGPDNVFVLVQSAAHGRKAGLSVVVGLCTGLMVHTLAVALGLATLVATSPGAFTLLRITGALYLTVLAWQAFRAPSGRLGNTAGGPEPAAGRLYLRGVIMNLTNPKVLLFFLAFLPQFVDPAAGQVSQQTCWFGFVFIAATLLTFGTIAQLAGLLGEYLRRSEKAQKVLNRATAVVLAGLAVRLFLSR